MFVKKLLVVFINYQQNHQLVITLLKENCGYLLKVEYKLGHDKYKETNHLIDDKFVYRLFNNLKDIMDNTNNFSKNDVIANMEIYYGKDNCLKQTVTKKLLEQSDNLKNLFKWIFNYIDESISLSL